MAGIQTIVDEQPGWGTRKVWATLRKRRGLVVSRRRVWTRQDGVVAITRVVDCGDRFLLACGVDWGCPGRC